MTKTTPLTNSDLEHIRDKVQSRTKDMPPSCALAVVQPSDMIIGARIGLGGFSEVRAVQLTNTDRLADASNLYAIKKIRSDLPSEKYIQALYGNLIEVRFLSFLKHENITAIKAISSTEIGGLTHSGSFYIILERLSETLADKLCKWRQQEKKLIPHRDRSRMKHTIITCMAKALTHLHENKIIHRDIKPENIGFNAEKQLKIFDFGLSRLAPDGKITGKSGTWRYMAPEVSSKNSYSFSADTYSWAIVAFETITLKTPYANFNKTNLDQHHFKNQVRPNGALLPKKYRQLIQNAWSQDPEKRPSMKTITESLNANVDLSATKSVEKQLRYLLSHIKNLDNYEKLDA